MKKFVAWAVMAASAVGVAGLGVVACSGSSASAPPENDASPDHTSSEASTSDVNTHDVTTSETGPDSPSEGSTIPEGSTTDGPVEGSTTCEAFDAGALDDAAVAAGFEQMWQVYKCYSCHQKKSQIVDDAGKGIVLSGNNDGLGDSGTIFPPNLTPDPATGVGCWTNQQLANAILEGIDQDGGALCPSMPKWGTAIALGDAGFKPGTPMDAGTAQEIIEYLRSLPPVVNKVPDTTCGSGPDAGPPDGGDGGHEPADGGDAGIVPDGGDAGPHDAGKG